VSCVFVPTTKAVARLQTNTVDPFAR